MADYKKMYAQLFNKVTDVIEELQEVQRQAENMYIESFEPEIVLFNTGNDTADSNCDKQKRKSPSSKSVGFTLENRQKRK
jgi:hypothetical protein